MEEQYPDQNLDQAVLSVRAGDTSAFAVIIQETEIKVRVILAAILPSSASIDDIAQEVYLIVYRKLDTYEIGTSFVAWLKTITRNLALNERRRWIREQGLKQRYQVAVEDKIQERQRKIIERADETMGTKLADCIELLHEPFKSLVKDFYYKENSSKHLAEKLGKSDGAIRLMLWRSRNTLAKCLKNKQTV